MVEYIYVLKLRPDLLDDDAWTNPEEKIVSDHFKRLEMDTESGKVILAGRTLTNTPDGFGIVIFNDKSWESAKKYMENDPAVKKGVMTATLFPYRTALMKK